jgi:hypothetical protein
MSGILTVEPYFRIEPDEAFSGRGVVWSLNAVYRIGGKKMAHVSIAFPRASWGPGRWAILKIPFLMTWTEFQKHLEVID